MKYANRQGYSDMEPFEVVRIVSEKCLEVRAMKCERDTSVKLDFQAGGFSAHCSNQNEQKWTYASNPEARVFKIRLNKFGMWKSHASSGDYFFLSDEPKKFYDYNF